MRLARLRYLLFSAGLLGTLSALAAAPLTGTWTASVHEDRLALDVHPREHGETETGLILPRSAFQDLDTSDGPATAFRLDREAGTLFFKGRFEGGEGAGHFRFEPSGTFPGAMAALGYPKIEAKEQLQLALFDLGPARLRALAELGYPKLSHEELLQVGIFQVTPESIREVKALGFANPSLQQLLAMRIHGVTPTFVREIREAGQPRVTLDQLVELRIHGIDAAYVRALSARRSPK